MTGGLASSVGRLVLCACVSSVPAMASSDPNCSLEALRSERRCFAAYLRTVAARLVSEAGVSNEEISKLLRVDNPDEFLESLLVPAYFMYVFNANRANDYSRRAYSRWKGARFLSSKIANAISSLRQLIQAIRTDCKLPGWIRPTENGLLTAAISIGSSVGMRTPKGPLNVRLYSSLSPRVDSNRRSSFRPSDI